jgi:hypothetical protein
MAQLLIRNPSALRIIPVIAGEAGAEGGAATT